MAAVGVNSLIGALVDLVLIVVFFVWSGSVLGQAFKLLSSSKLLAILAVAVAVIGLVLAARPGRRIDGVAEGLDPFLLGWIEESPAAPDPESAGGQLSADGSGKPCARWRLPRDDPGAASCR